MSRILEARRAISIDGTLYSLMSKSQKITLHLLLKGEEAGAIADSILEVAKRFETMPKTYETDGQGADAIAYLHYFRGGIDAWITEKDAGDPDEGSMRQLQAFGAINFGNGAELGYVNIEELVANNLEVDLYWTPKPLKECMK